MLEEGDVAHDVSLTFDGLFLSLFFFKLWMGMCCVRVALYACLSWFLLDFAFRELGMDVWIQHLSDGWFDENSTIDPHNRTVMIIKEQRSRCSSWKLKSKDK